jgi:hypothetical protein
MDDPANSFRISQAELAENREGRIANTQREKIGTPTLLNNQSVIIVVLTLLLGILLPIVLLRQGIFIQLAVWLLLIGLSFGFILGMQFVIAWRGLRRLRSDLTAGVVKKADVRSIWNKQQLLLETTDVSLKNHLDLKLPPGTYHVYFLPNSRFILSIDLASDNVKTLKEDVLNILMEAFGFNAEQLQTNRIGDLASGQQKHLRSLLVKQLAALVFFSSLLVFFIFALVTSLSKDNIIEQIIFILSSTLFLFLTPLIGIRIVSALLDMWHGNVINAVHVVTPEYIETNGVKQYFYSIGKQKFPVSKRAFDALVPSDYRIYYTPRSKTLVALEPVDVNEMKQS